MTDKPNNYNLLTEPWIPVLWNDGKYGRVGTKEALAQAGRIRQIAASNPMDRVAILRFLLALLYWCKGNPPGERSTTSDEPLAASWFSKLDEHGDCFNLFGEGPRFYQCAPSKGARVPEKLAADYLIHEVPTGTNKWHFRHSTDGVDGLCPACCAMGLIRLPLFATSGGRGKPPGVNAKPPIYVIPVGKSLAATLRLSWRKAPNLGTPGWLRPDAQIPKAGEIPLLMGLTWLPRRVWLDDPDDPETTCISCGRTERLIRLCIFAGIGSTRTEEGSPGRVWRDPHVIYETSSKGETTSLHASDALGASDAAAGQWTRLLTGLIREHKTFNTASNIWVVGFSSVQNDKYLEATESVIALPSSLEQIQENIESIERWRKQCWSLPLKARPPNEKPGSGRKHVEIPAAIDVIRPDVENRVTLKAANLLSGGDAPWEQAAREYGPMMEAVAWALAPGFTSAAVMRRRQIAGAIPDMRPRAEPAKKPSRKKGEDK